MYQRPKLCSFTLPNVERPHIYRDPPASVHTRKYEPTSEAEVLHNIRNSDVGQGRISESISYYARGTNPMVDVDYGTSAGNGARTLTLPTHAGSNPYKAFRDGAFRPPIYPLETRLPLSRMKHPTPAVSTNPIVSLDSINPTLSTSVDRHLITSTVAGPTNTTPVRAQPSLSYRVTLPTDIFGDGMMPAPSHSLRADDRVLQGSWSVAKAAPTFNAAHVSGLHREVTPSGSIVLTPLTASTTTNLSFGRTSTVGLDPEQSTHPTLGTLKSTDKQLILGAVQPNFALIVYDNSTGHNTHVPGTIQDKQNIAVQAALGQPLTLSSRTTGEPIKVKDYRWKVIQSAMGSDALVISLTADSNLTQQKLRELTLESKVSGGTVSSAVHNMNSGAAMNYHEGIASLQARSTNADVIHTPGISMFKSSAAENSFYQGGTSINDRQTAVNVTHSRKGGAQGSGGRCARRGFDEHGVDGGGSAEDVSAAEGHGGGEGVGDYGLGWGWGG